MIHGTSLPVHKTLAWPAQSHCSLDYFRSLSPRRACGGGAALAVENRVPVRMGGDEEDVLGGQGVFMPQGSLCMRAKRNVIPSRPTGTGNTYPARTLMHSVCRDGRSAVSKRTPHLCRGLRGSRAHGSFGKLLNSKSGVAVRVMDDSCMNPMPESERRELLNRTISTQTACREPAPDLPEISEQCFIRACRRFFGT